MTELSMDQIQARMGRVNLFAIFMRPTDKYDASTPEGRGHVGRPRPASARASLRGDRRRRYQRPLAGNRLARAGIEVEVLEASENGNVFGIRMALQAPALRALDSFRRAARRHLRKV